MSYSTATGRTCIPVVSAASRRDRAFAGLVVAPEVLSNEQFSACLFKRDVTNGMRPKFLCHMFFECRRFEQRS
jgi:hypothetical protein